MDLCGPVRVESINGKKYVLVIVDEYSRYAWTLFLRSKDETPEVLINFIRLVQRGLHAQVRTVRTDKGTDGENLDKMKEKGNPCIFVGYNKRTRLIVETIHVNFGELPQMASDHVSSDPAPKYETVTTSLNELDMLSSPMFDEYFNGAFVVSTADTYDKHQQQNTTPSTSTTISIDMSPLIIPTPTEATIQALTQEPTITTSKNINQANIQAEIQEENVMADEDEFINI
nr:ribonuclease H-like domain-containing protein [Tanacetum cinerariifolium]